MPRCQSRPPAVSRSATGQSFTCMSTLRVSTSRSVVCNAEARRWKLWVASAGSSNRGDHDGGADQAGRVLLTSRHRVGASDDGLAGNDRGDRRKQHQRQEHEGRTQAVENCRQ